jgi:hypothetical protein
MSSDKFDTMSDTPERPGREMFLITPHATNPITPLPKALRFDGAGTVTLRAVDSGADITINVAAGEVLDVRAAYVRAAGTTATPIHGIA